MALGAGCPSPLQIKIIRFLLNARSQESNGKLLLSCACGLQKYVDFSFSLPPACLYVGMGFMSTAPIGASHLKPFNRFKKMDTKAFIDTFNSTGNSRHRYEVFRDFVTLSSISLHNAVCPYEKVKTELEKEYMKTVASYGKSDISNFPKMLGELINLLEVEPMDVLGQLYMNLDLGNKNTGQFFTPPHISELMARVIYGDSIEKMTEEFVTLSEPACRAGGMILSFVKVMIEKNINPAQKLWVQAIDVDRTAALMCYLQLSLWNVPAQVIVGNAITLELRETYYTPAHYLFNWQSKLNRKNAEKEALKIVCEPNDNLKKKVFNKSDQMSIFDC